MTLYPHPSAFRGSTRESIVQRAAHALDDLLRGAGIKPKPAVAAAAPEI